MKTKTDITTWLPNIVGKGYGTFWNSKQRYRIVKGSRASKKSKTMALWSIYSMLLYPEANMLVVRKTFRSLKDSCYSDLKWAIHRLGVDAYFLCKESPLEITYKPTGQKILFRGLDDPLKVTSITVETGVLCWLWIEEAYEIFKEDDFNTLNEGIRGIVSQGLFKQTTLTFNPWSDKHWIKKRFFDSPDEDTLAMTTTYLMNEWLDDIDRKEFERMKLNNPKRYKVAGLGDWGVIDGLVYENFEEQIFDVAEISKKSTVQSAFGLDFGYTNDPTALCCMLADTVARKIYVFDEMYKKGMLNRMIAAEISRIGYTKEQIIADSAENKSIAELRELGLRIKPARKGPDSIVHGIQFIQGFKILVHPRCTNFLTEINNYQWAKDKFNNLTGKPEDNMNHLMDAMRYGMEKFMRQSGGVAATKVIY